MPEFRTWLEWRVRAQRSNVIPLNPLISRAEDRGASGRATSGLCELSALPRPVISGIAKLIWVTITAVRSSFGPFRSPTTVGNDCSALDHHVNARPVSKDREVVEWIPIDQQQIGQLACLDAAEVVVRAKDLGIGLRRRQ